MKRLLRAMQAPFAADQPRKRSGSWESRISPACLVEHHHVDPETRIEYKKVVGEASGLPLCSKWRSGCRRKEAPGPSAHHQPGSTGPPPRPQPFAALDSYLNTALVSRGAPCRGRGRISPSRARRFGIEASKRWPCQKRLKAALEPSVEQVTQPLDGEAKRQPMRSHRADERAEELMRKQERAQYPSVKEAAYQLMPQAYLAASGQGRYVAHARQIMYAARRQILAMIHPDKAAKGLEFAVFHADPASLTI